MTLIFTLTLSCPLFAQDDSASKTKPSTPIVGDTNADGVVDITDSRNIAADLGGAPSGNHGDTDLNNDGVVNAEDCHILAQAIMDKLAESKSSKSNSSRSSDMNSGEMMMMDSIGSTVTLINGDFTGDNVIDDFDLNEVNSAFGVLGNWPTVPDMNGDGVVDDFELGMVNGNFGSVGDLVTNWSNSTASTGDYTLTIPISFGDYFTYAPGVSVYIMVKNQITGEIYNSTVTVPPTGAGVEINVPKPGLYDALVQPVNSHFLIKLEPDYQPVDNATCDDLSISNYTCDECWTGNSALNRFLETTTETQLELGISAKDDEGGGPDDPGDDLRCLWDGVTGSNTPSWIGNEGLPACGYSLETWGFGAIFCSSEVGAKTIKSTIYDLHQNLMCNDVDKTINWTITVYPRQPIVEFIEPSASADISGIAEIKVRIKRFIGNIGPFTPVLTIQENYIHDECTSFNDEKTIQGATVTIEKENTCSQYQTETYTWFYDTTQLHNGSHTLKLTLGYPAGDCPVTTDDEMEVTRGVNVQNLVISSVTPPDVIVIKEGETTPDLTITKQYAHGETITANLLLYDVSRNNGDSFVRIEKTFSASEPIKFSNVDFENSNIQSGIFTYEIYLSESYLDKGYIVSDFIYYRSQYTSIERATQDGQPVMEAEYAGYDDNNTPEDESDDQYMYYIRYYKLDDILSKDAHAGVIKLYNPDREVVEEWNVAGQECLADGHSPNDGLKVIQTFGAGVDPTHKLLLKVPIADMDTAGDYRFVLSVTDDHPYCYRDHQRRPVLEMNSVGKLHPALIISHSIFSDSAVFIEFVLTTKTTYRKIPTCELSYTDPSSTTDIKRALEFPSSISFPKWVELLFIMGHGSNTDSGYLVVSGDAKMPFSDKNVLIVNNMPTFNANYDDLQHAQCLLMSEIEPISSDKFEKLKIVITAGCYQHNGGKLCDYITYLGCSETGGISIDGNPQLWNKDSKVFFHMNNQDPYSRGLMYQLAKGKTITDAKKIAIKQYETWKNRQYKTEIDKQLHTIRCLLHGNKNAKLN